MNRATVRIRAKLSLLAVILAVFLGAGIGPAPTWASDRKTGTKTFASSASYSSGTTTYSSGFLVEAYSEGVIEVSVTAAASGSSLVITIETSDDNSTYYHLEDFDQIRRVCTAAFRVTNFGKYVRIKHMVTAGSMTYEIKATFKN